MSGVLYGIFGASGFGREVAPLGRAQLQGQDGAQLVFVDDNPPAERVNGIQVLAYDAFCAQPAAQRRMFIAIADGHIREKLVQRCTADGIGFWSVRADNVVVMDDVKLGEGAVLSPFVTLTSNIRIGCHFHANIYSYVAHDCVIGDYVTFAPGVHCNGNIVIEDHAYIGTGAIIKQGKPGRPLVIGAGAVVGMGGVVTKSVPAGSTVIGNPARPLSRKALG